MNMFISRGKNLKMQIILWMYVEKYWQRQQQYGNRMIMKVTVRNSYSGILKSVK